VRGRHVLRDAQLVDGLVPHGPRRPAGRQVQQPAGREEPVRRGAGDVPERCVGRGQPIRLPTLRGLQRLLRTQAGWEAVGRGLPEPQQDLPQVVRCSEAEAWHEVVAEDDAGRVVAHGRREPGVQDLRACQREAADVNSRKAASVAPEGRQEGGHARAQGMAADPHAQGAVRTSGRGQLGQSGLHQRRQRRIQALRGLEHAAVRDAVEPAQLHDCRLADQVRERVGHR